MINAPSLFNDFNPRSSCEERLLVSRHLAGSLGISIHAPHARSDQGGDCQPSGTGNFNPRSSCEERHIIKFMLSMARTFQSTLLMRGATEDYHAVPLHGSISIHAPHARSDSRPAIDSIDRSISIHAPHARSDGDPSQQADVIQFQSTLLMRGATPGLCGKQVPIQISIHAPHARSD